MYVMDFVYTSVSGFFVWKLKHVTAESQCKKVSLVSEKTIKVFSKVPALICIPTGNKQESLWLHSHWFGACQGSAFHSEDMWWRGAPFISHSSDGI